MKIKPKRWMMFKEHVSVNRLVTSIRLQGILVRPFDKIKYLALLFVLNILGHNAVSQEGYFSGRVSIVNGVDNNGSDGSLKIFTQGNQTMLLDGNEIDAVTGQLYIQANVDHNLILAGGGGNVGIATSAPEKLLDISTGDRMWDNAIVRIKGTLNPTLDIHSTSNWHPRLRLLTHDGDNTWGLSAAGSVNKRPFLITYNDSIDYFSIMNDGKVGIGTTNPTAKLQVNGGLKIGNSTPFDPDPNFYENDSYIAFRHSGISEDFIGYRNNSFYFKDSPGGADVSDPNLIVGGNVGIGTDSPTEKLDVAGVIKADELKLNIGSFPDYVFAEDYTLMPLEDLESFIRQNKHLPNMPTEAEVLEKGMKVGQINTLLVEKVEELTLHTIRQEKEIASHKQEVGQLKREIHELKLMMKSLVIER